MSALLLLLACVAEPAGDSAAPADPVFAELEAPALLRRLSLDLRGLPPSVEEVLAVEEDPAALEQLREEMLTDPLLEERLVDMLAWRWLSLTEDYPLSAEGVGLDPLDEHSWRRSIGEEPLRLAAHVALSDRPWTDVLLVDYTMANELLVQTWPLQWRDGAPEQGEWAPALWTDDRPAAGVLASNGLRWRYTEATYARSLAAALSKLLLCDDYLLRPVSFDSPSLSEEELLEATRTDEACLNCHATLDGVASAMFGMEFFDFYSLEDFATYHPERERLGMKYLGVAPSFYGQPIEGLVELGPVMAQDPRATWCAVDSFASALWHRQTEAADHEQLTELHAGFLDEGERVPALLRALTDTAEYRAGDIVEDAAAAAAEEDPDQAPATRRTMAPRQLADSVAALTGFRWTWQGAELLDDDDQGFRAMVGGPNPPLVDVLQRGHGLSRELVIERLAQAAADHAVQGDLVEGGGPGLLTEVDLDSRPGDAAFDAQLDLLGRRMLGRAPSDEEGAAQEALWQQALELSDPATAWTVLVGGLLRSPDFWSY